jgi:hypothetical protein
MRELLVRCSQPAAELLQKKEVQAHAAPLFLI